MIIAPPSSIRWLVLLAAAAATGGCTSARPLTAAEVREAGLLDVQRAAAVAIDRAHADDEVTWRTGWVGTAMRDGAGVMGSCTDWQALVYRAVRPVVEQPESPWSLWFIRVDPGRRSEHNAVLIYRTAWLTPRRRLLPADRGSPAYVLDAWDRGRADLFHIAAWIDRWKSPSSVAELYDPAEELRLRAAPAADHSPD